MPYLQVDVDLGDFDTLDLIQELNDRRRAGDSQAREWAQGAIVAEADIKQIVEKIYMCRVFKVDDTEYVRELVDRVLGRII